MWPDIFFNSTVFLFSVYFFPRIVKFTMLCHTWYFLFINFQMRAAFFYSRAKLFITIRFGGGAYVVVWFYPWFKFYFLLFLGIVMYGNDFESKENKIWTRDIIEPQNLFTVNCELKLWTVSFHLDQLSVAWYWIALSSNGLTK